MDTICRYHGQMSILDKLRQLFSGESKSSDPSDNASQLDGLAEKMSAMRGENVSISEGQGNFAPNRDGIKNLSDAAKDARIINKSNEDRAISDITDYRSTRD